jgi:hypothetical protein
MNSRDIVKRAIHFAHPPRLPVLIGELGMCDTAWVPRRSSARALAAEPHVDEWGCRWGHTEVPNMGQVVGHPLHAIGGLDRHPFPDYTDDS